MRDLAIRLFARIARNIDIGALNVRIQLRSMVLWLRLRIRQKLGAALSRRISESVVFQNTQHHQWISKSSLIIQ